MQRHRERNVNLAQGAVMVCGWHLAGVWLACGWCVAGMWLACGWRVGRWMLQLERWAGVKVEGSFDRQAEESRRGCRSVGGVRVI